MRELIASVVRILVVLVYIVIASALLMAAPILLGNKPTIVLSGSMEPDYPVGSLTYYKAAEFQDIKAGDVITFRIGGGSLATHRVVAKDEQQQTFATKGDNNPSQDTVPVAYQDVEGKTLNFAIPFAGYYAHYLRNWSIIAILGAVLLLDILLGRATSTKEQ